LDIAEEPITRHDGKVIIAHTVKSPIRDATGKVVMTVGVCRDITESKQTENRLSHATRMASVGTLAASVAHEINNPLMYAMANIELIRELVASDAPRSNVLSELEGLLTEVSEGMDRVRLIVRGLRSFSRADDNRRERVDVQQVVTSAVKLAHNEVRHRARLTIEMARQPAFVEANESQLVQVVLNLLVNAAHAIPEGQTQNHEIRVATRTDDPAWVSIAVSDTGRGIRAEDLPRLFEPFYTTKAVGEGTGLGLSIAHNLVEAHGGRIEVDSTPGEGSTFRILLPRTIEKEAPNQPAVRPIATTGGRLRVLVVDDEPAIVNILTKALAREHEVFAFHNAALAVETIVRGERYDVILCDLMMPTMSGIDFFDATARLDPEQQRRIVFLTGGAFTEHAEAFLEAVDNPVLDKPLEIAKLRAVVRAICGPAGAPSRILTKRDAVLR
jgi:signal transduction histidine kinase/CheY-like chemotaxis protein